MKIIFVLYGYICRVLNVRFILRVIFTVIFTSCDDFDFILVVTRVALSGKKSYSMFKWVNLSQTLNTMLHTTLQTTDSHHNSNYFMGLMKTVNVVAGKGEKTINDMKYAHVWCWDLFANYCFAYVLLKPLKRNPSWIARTSYAYFLSRLGSKVNLSLKPYPTYRWKYLSIFAFSEQEFLKGLTYHKYLCATTM